MHWDFRQMRRDRLNQAPAKVLYVYALGEGHDNLLLVEALDRANPADPWLHVINGAYYLQPDDGEDASVVCLHDTHRGEWAFQHGNFPTWTARHVLTMLPSETQGLGGYNGILERARLLLEGGAIPPSYEQLLENEAQAANPETPFDLDRYEAMACEF